LKAKAVTEALLRDRKQRQAKPEVKSEAEPTDDKLPCSDAPRRKCSRIGCDNRYPLVRRRGRNRSSRKQHAPTAYHDGRRYCSDTCRKLASKARRSADQSSPKRPKNTPKKRGSGQVLSTVTSDASYPITTGTFGDEKTGRAPPPKAPTRAPRDVNPNRLPKGIVPDERYPDMYRLRLPGGGLSDMVNLTRAKDALEWLHHRKVASPSIVPERDEATVPQESESTRFQ
jgi:hypothetical protein